jgi:signal transduction histidine kinase
VKLALEERFDAVVLDLLENGKPVGLDLLKEIRLKRPFLPLVIFTIAPEMKYVQSAMRGDVSYYLTKPVRGYQDVIRAVEVAIEKEKAKERLVKARYLANIGQLAAGVAHFVKNSLWNITSRVQIMLDETDKKDKHYEMLQTIKRRCDETNKFVLNLLQFAQRGQVKDEMKEINIVEVIQDVLKLLDQEMKNAGIEPDIQVIPGEVKLTGNVMELQEVFLNIIKNAIEAMPQGGKLSVNISPGERAIKIGIADTGTGMGPEVLENIFIPFYTTKENATGFGLFDTQRLILKHGGDIKVDSWKGEGSVFTIEIPYKKPGEVNHE